jgi:HEPN domain-containing protein
MQREEIIKFWMEKSEEHLISMLNMFGFGEYPWALFVGHLAIEKILKSYYVKTQNTSVPYTHNLLWLAESTKLLLSDDQKEFLITVTRFNIEARYEDYKRELYKMATKEFTESWINKIKEFHSWMKKKI